MDEAFKFLPAGETLLQKLSREAFDEKEIIVDILRLDKIHPVISGNKWFKLKYHLASALKSGHRGIASFGGAWSNHLVALAFACRQHGLKSIGIIRGEAPAVYNASMQQMRDFGMELVFITRERYRLKEIITKELLAGFPDYYYVPEGGGGAEGIKGAEEIISLVPDIHYTNIICAVGTGTTMTGIINHSKPGQHILGISSLKINDTPADHLHNDNHPGRYITRYAKQNNYSLNHDYHFGGYARHTPELIAFMNDLYKKHDLPTDIVYTAKLFYGIFDLVKKDHFKKGGKLLVIHSGGLLGNRSLPHGILDF
ncbi:MAG: pyridoxal-phosphate dependent enzyme [Flavitalea sp.]